MFFGSGVSTKTFTGIYGDKIAGFDLEDPDNDAAEPYTRWERRKEIVKLIYRLERKETSSHREETCSMVPCLQPSSRAMVGILFFLYAAAFNQDIGQWNVSQVTYAF